MKGLSKGRYDETLAGEDVCLVTNHQCICLMNKVEKMTQEDKVPVAKTVKKSVCVNSSGGNVSKA